MSKSGNPAKQAEKDQTDEVVRGVVQAVRAGKTAGIRYSDKTTIYISSTNVEEAAALASVLTPVSEMTVQNTMHYAMLNFQLAAMQRPYRKLLAKFIADCQDVYERFQ